MNSWLGGFESILKRMTPSNFDWFLHTMLFYHSKNVIQSQKNKKNSKGKQKDDDKDEDVENADDRGDMDNDGDNYQNQNDVE